ncbi:MAG: hypothetical protein ACKO3R_06350 [bacterium]
MGKKKRKRKITLYAVLEGRRERFFFKILEELYLDKKSISISVNLDKGKGGGGDADTLINEAIHNNDRDRCFVWLDEDKEIKNKKSLAQVWNISEEDRESFNNTPLAKLQNNFNANNKKRPTLIVSKPRSVESFILKVLGKELPKNLNTLKNALDGIIKGVDESGFYKDHLTLKILEEKRKEIPELDLLISMLECD